MKLIRITKVWYKKTFLYLLFLDHWPYFDFAQYSQLNPSTSLRTKTPSSLCSVPPLGGGGGFLPAVIRRLFGYLNIMCMAFSHAGIRDLYKSCIL